MFERLGDSIYSYANSAHNTCNSILDSQRRVDNLINTCLENLYQAQLQLNGAPGTAAPVIYGKLKDALVELNNNISGINYTLSSSESYVNNVVVQYNNYKEEKRRREEEERRRREEEERRRQEMFYQQYGNRSYYR